jgi:predicted PurR-regulated permease PerM
MTSNEKVDLGTKLLVRAALLVGGLYLLFLLRDVVFVVLFAVLTAAALMPALNKLQAWGLSRTMAVILVYTLLFIGGVALVGVCIPILFTEVKEFLGHWPEYTDRLSILLSGLDASTHTLGFSFDKQALIGNLEGSMSEWFGGFFSTTLNLFQGFIHAIGFFFLALYLSLEEKGIEKFFLMLTPDEYHQHARSLASRMQGKVSQWLFGQALLMLIAFVIYYIGLSIIGVPYALAIAVFGGLMEIIPYLGPVLAVIPALILGFLTSPGTGLAVLVFYLIAHQAEAHIIAPQVMKRSANLNPVVLIIAILIGIELGGPLGVILAVPLTMVLSVFVEDIFEKKQG